MNQVEERETGLMRRGEGPLVSPLEDVAEFERRLKQLREFIARNMRDGVDYGIIPGVTKPSLFKPGAEKLLRWHGLVVDVHILPHSRLDVTGPVIDIDVEGVVRSVRSGECLGTVHANANSEERRYRKAREPGEGREPATLGDQKNTLLKVADKRAWVASALLYTPASDTFTQDVEDGVATIDEQVAPKGLCPKHKVPFVHRTGTKRDGTPYDFWSCPTKENGGWCKERPPLEKSEMSETEAPSKPQDADSGPTIEQIAEMKRLVAAAGWSAKEFADYLMAMCNVKTVKQLTCEQADSVIAYLAETSQHEQQQVNANAM